MSTDSRIARWLERFNRLTAAFHQQAMQDVQHFLANEPITASAAQNAFIISKYDADAYGLTDLQLSTFQKAASDQIRREDIFNPRFDNLRKWYHKATALGPETHYMTYALDNNAIDIVLFRYDVERNESGVPVAQLCDEGFSRSVTVQLFYPNGPRFENAAKFETSHIGTSDAVHIETLSVEAGKAYTLTFFDGYAARGRSVTPASTTTGKPSLGPLVGMRS